MSRTAPRHGSPVAPRARGDRNAGTGGFRPDVEGLRAVAVLLVVAYHAGIGLLPGGYIGVDVFFVLSGFLITGLLVREHRRTGRVSLQHFYARRARRLLPAATLTMLAVAAASAWVMPAVRAREVATDGLWAALFGANLRFAQTGTDYLMADAPPSPLQHYWSLAVEEQFYLLWPLLVLGVGALAGRHLQGALRVVLVLMVGGSLALSVQQTATDATWAYFSPFTRAYELGAGALVAVSLPLVARLRRTFAAALSLVGLALVGWGAVAYDERTAFPGSAAAVPVLGVVLLLAAGTADPGGRVQQWLSTAVLQRLGALSYSWYLWHWPALVLTAAYVGRELTVLEGIACVSVALTLSAVTYALVENPVRHVAPLVSRPRASLAMGACLMVAVLVAFQSLAATSGAPTLAAQETAAAKVQATLREQPLPRLEQRVAVVAKPQPVQGAVRNASFARRDMHPAARDGCQAAPTRAALPSGDKCWYGDVRATRTVAVLGDSHASMWLPALDLLGERKRFRVLHLAKTSCPAADVVTVHHDLKRAFTECSRFRDAAIKRIGDLRPDLVILASSRNDGDVVVDGRRLSGDARLRVWQEGLASTLRRLAPSGARLAVLGDIPFQDSSVLDCIDDRDRLRRCGTPRSRAVDTEFLAAERRAARAAAVSYIDPTPLLCTARRCPLVVGDLVAYYDRRHVSASFAISSAGALSTLLRL